MVPTHHTSRPLCLDDLPMTRALLILLLWTMPLAIQAHGTMTSPVSRILQCYQQGAENPTHPSCAALKAISGSQAMYDWMGVNQANANGNHQAVVPDGKLCSGGNPAYAGLDLARNDWQAQAITPDSNGHVQFEFHGTAPHASQNWIFYITRPGYDPTQPLRWADLDEFCRYGNVPLGTDSRYRFDCVVPARTGRHVIYNVWQRSDSAEAFYTCIDAQFQGNGGSANDALFAHGFEAASGGVTDAIAPSVPANLSSPSQSSSTINLSWNAATDNQGGSGLSHYEILRGGLQVGMSTGLTWQDSGLNASTVYSYQVRARDLAGNGSAPSAAVTVSTQALPPPASNARVTAYFTQWGIYGRNYQVRNIETNGTADRITHLNYAFGNVRNNRCEVGISQASDPNTGVGGDAWADYGRSFNAAESIDGVADVWNQSLRGNWNQLRKLKQRHPHLKVLISLGGWTWSRGFASAARAENREAFVASCIDAYIRGNLPVVDNAGGLGAAAGVFDGIDIDWEYPNACGLACGSAEDRANYTALLAEFRRQLDLVQPGLELTVAVGAGVEKIRATDPGQYHPYVNSILVMSYDFHGTWEASTNHHSALYGSAADPSTGDVRLYNTHDALEAFRTRGVPASKLALGIGFYGRGWAGVPAGSNHGLYQSATGPAPGTWEAGNEDYKVLKTLAWPSYRDATSGAHWIYQNGTFWSFDDPVSIVNKMNYVRQQGIGGVFFWELSGDDAQGSLSAAIQQGLSAPGTEVLAKATCPHHD